MCETRISSDSKPYSGFKQLNEIVGYNIVSYDNFRFSTHVNVSLTEVEQLNSSIAHDVNVSRGAQNFIFQVSKVL